MIYRSFKSCSRIHHRPNEYWKSKRIYVHAAAREATSEMETFAARSCCYAVAKAHVMKHSLPCSEYAAKESDRLYQYKKLLELSKL